jgi:predicted flap endonuclease-1-like 5' DNA nuclease
MDIFVNDITLSFLQWFLVSLVAFLLGIFLGWWLWYKYRSLSLQLEAEKKREHELYTELEKDHAGLKYQYDESKKDASALKTSLNRCEADKAVLRHKLDKALAGEEGESMVAGASRSLGAREQVAPPVTDFSSIFTTDNLQIFEGIGPKIEKLLKEARIYTWHDLANAAPESLTTIIEGAGAQYKMHNPEDWPKQARMAIDGQWEDLISFQKARGSATDEGPSKVEKMAAKILGFSDNPDDLKIVEGIGPKIEKLLKDAGINNWSDLAASSADKLRGVLDAAGENFRLADPSTWPKQAELASAGKWKELSEYQEFLEGGKDPV